MKIYTSYFSNGKKLAEAGVVMIGIALYPPKWFSGTSLKYVAPTASILFAKGQTSEEYTRRYKAEVLARVNPQLLIESLRQLGKGRDVALCCFEKPESFCHRHILAEWLTAKTGIEITEFGYVPKKPEPQQLSLF